jgi:hypothetical protein
MMLQILHSMRKHTDLKTFLFFFQIEYAVIPARVISFTPTKKVRLSFADIRENHKFPVAMCLDSLYLIELKSDNKYGKCLQISFGF